MKRITSKLIVTAASIAAFAQTAFAQKTASQLLSSMESNAQSVGKSVFLIVQIVVGIVAAVAALVVYIQSNNSGQQSKDKIISIFGITLAIVVFLEICKAFFLS